MGNVLVFCAHADDEIGCSGAIQHLAIKHKIYVATCTDGVGARGYDPIAVERRNEHHQNALGLLGAIALEKRWWGNFLDNQMDMVSLLEVAKWAESILHEFEPEIILTHHIGDLNVDHQVVAKATTVALRPGCFPSVKKIYAYEVPSSTEWGSGFMPNTFTSLTEKQVKLKIASACEYKDEMRTYPHPRSPEALLVRAQYWGVVSGLPYAEPLLVLRNVL